MCEIELRKYESLNKLAKGKGTVIFGTDEDINIPLGELKQAFALDSCLYNRSLSDLSIENAVAAYDRIIAPICPDSVLIHIGANDIEIFKDSPNTFDNLYRKLIDHIRALNKNCEIGVICLKNPEDRTDIAALNRRLKFIAQSEGCEYGDIENPRVWNPQSTKDVISFVYSMGFVRPLKIKRPIYNLVKILFCYEPAML